MAPVGLGFGGADWMSESLDELTVSLTMDDFRAPPEPEGAGEICREPGAEVTLAGWDACFCFCFFLVDSFPLDSERFGEPGRFNVFFFRGSVCLGRPDGVFVPLLEVPEATLDSSFALALASSSFFLSCSFSFSSSEVSSSL